jgi:GNAT superfamily N-acetyltransferase
MHEPNLQRIDASGAALVLASADEQRHLREGETFHRELRTQIEGDYLDLIARLFADGTHLTQLVDGGEVQAIAVWRGYHTTYDGRRFEVDDLVTRASARSRGYGATMIREMERKARLLGCGTVALNSGTHRLRAHKFYFREGFAIAAFHFTKSLA